jgi:hypothetical protein
MSLRNLVAKNYESHPSFATSEVGSWIVTDELIKEFNSVYQDSRQPLTTAEFSQVLKSLERVFSELESQTKDREALRFLLELHSLCVSFIRQEYAFRKRLKLNPSSGIRSTKTKALLQENFYFGNLSPKATARIQEIITPLIDEFRKRAGEGKLDRSDLSQDSGLQNWRIGSILDKEFKKQGVFGVLKEAFGIRYRYTGMAIELSGAGSTWWKDALGQETPPATMYAHLDETVYAPKSIVYLSEVSEENGPTSCYPAVYASFNNSALQDIIGRVVGGVGSAVDSPLRDYYGLNSQKLLASASFRRHFMMLPRELRFNSHFGWDVVPGSELEAKMKSKELVMTGPPGKFIVFDGSQLLHRGGLIEAGERIALQVVFYPGNKWVHRLSSALKGLLGTKRVFSG